MLFEMTTPVAESPKSITGDRFIQIKSATWGENCNQFVLSAQAQLKAKNETKDMPQLVRKDNALRSVSSLCNGRETCAFPVSPAALGFDPVKDCAKNMEIEYRCFITDMAHKVTAGNDDIISIDCHAATE